MTASGGEGEFLVFEAPPDIAGARLDQALAGLLPDRSRAFVRKLLEGGGVTVDGEVPKPSRRMRGGERIEVFIPEPTRLELVPEELPLDVLYEDDSLVVVNKRPGMVAHPSQGHRGGTLVNALLHHYGDGLSAIGGVLRPGIVHRLDKDTSGCLVAAKTDAAHRRLIGQFMERAVDKIYLAITEGVPRPPAGRVEGRMGRSHRDRKLHAMLKSGGRHSSTRYETIENYGVLALVECRLLTGRTHQARVHMAYLGSPVLCDRDYGGRESFSDRELAAALDLYRHGAATRAGAPVRPARAILSRQALHAWRLSFEHPVDGGRMHFEAPLPDDMLAVLAPLRAARSAMDCRGG